LIFQPMQVTPSNNLLSELHRTGSWQTSLSRTPIEHLMEYILTGTLAPNAPLGTEELADRVLRLDVHSYRAVVLGGGTGLSTIVGGNSQMADWPERPAVGIKEDFPRLTCIVCTTDDGGSTGQLLKYLPMIGIGDLRKLLLSSILIGHLQRKYGLGDAQAADVIRLIHAIFNYRFPEDSPELGRLANPILAAPVPIRRACPKPLGDSLRRLGTYISEGGPGPSIVPQGHSLGNLLLASAIFTAADGRAKRPPRLREIQRGIDHIAGLIGAPVRQIHAATATPGQLKFRYANGVEVYGQNKSARSRRDSPVERVTAEFVRMPSVSVAVQKAIADADLIIYAPGSLYTSIIPILQLDRIASAIRSNRRALKVLGANSWIQEGETDISLRNQGRGFLVSELIEAYDRNIPGGVAGLFDVVLSANLEQIPGNILRNYALEGKSPIHLDRSRVEAMGLPPVEATLLSPEHQRQTQVIHHDARRFALAVRTLLYADKCLGNKEGYTLRRKAARTKISSSGRLKEENRQAPASRQHRGILLCDYLESVKTAIETKDFRPEILRSFLLNMAWENRDIRPQHLKYFRGAALIPPKEWNRSTDWDNIVGYFDPQDRFIKLHQDLLADPLLLADNFLVALGESLLGRYIEERRWIEQRGSRCYEIVLGSVNAKECFFNNSQLRDYLKLARMAPDPADNRIYRISINEDGGFLPPGLLFGLLYAWYLSGRGLTMEYEMTLLRWPLKNLIPLHARDRTRKEALVTFFRTQVFGHR